MNPKFPDREVPLGKRSRPGPVFARARRTRRRRQLKEREREREREKKTKKKRNDAPTIGTPRSLLSERITKDFSDDDDVVDFDRDDEVLLRSPVGRPRS